MARVVPEHLRVLWTIPRALLVGVSYLLFIPLAIGLVIVLVAGVWPSAGGGLDALMNGDVGANLVVDVSSGLAALAIIWAFLKRYKVGWSAVGLRKFPVRKTILYFVVGFVAFLILSTGLILLVSLLDPSFNAEQPQNNTYTESLGTHRLITLIALVIVPPIVEEIIFRGFIFPAIAKKWGVIAGAIISSALFGIAHMQANVGLYTFVLGLILCFLYIKLKSIIPGIAIHMLNNLLAYYALTAK